MAGIYLDHAAATPVDERVFAAMKPYLTDEFYNPSALYLRAKDVKKAVKQARQRVARVLGAKESEIIFTAGGTEANNLAIKGVLEAHSGSVVTSAIEHESVLAPVGRYKNQQVSVDNKGVIKLGELERAIDDDVVLVSVMYANNEIGTIQPIREVAAIINKVRHHRLQRNLQKPIYFHTDAAQATNYLPLLVNQLGIDLMTINGGKIYGPKQSGALYLRSGVTIRPIIDGGGQERGIRNGTENVPAIVGFSRALEIAYQMRPQEVKRLKDLQERFLGQLKIKLPHAVINGSRKHRLPNNVHITIPGRDNERLLMELDERGIMCATGSACSASNSEPSHVMRAIGSTDDDAKSSLRFTQGRLTTQKEIEQTVAVLAELCL